MTKLTFFRWWRQLVLAFSCLLLVIACNNSTPNAPEVGSSPSSPGSSPPAAGKIMKVAVDPSYAPFEFQGPNGQIQGFDVDIINGIGKSAGFQVQFENLRFDGTIPALQGGTVDAAIGSMTITEERLKAVDFSKPYFKSGLAITVQENNKDITSFDTLKNQRIAVIIGTTGAEAAKKITGAKITTFDSPDQVLQEVVNGNADAVVNDAPITLYAIKTGGLKGVKIVGNLITEEYYGIPTPKNSPNLEIINQGLDALIKEGTYKEIYKKWFNVDPPELPEKAPL